MTTRTHPWLSIATPSVSRSATTSHTAGCAGSRSAPPTSPACRFPGFPFVFKLDKTHRVDMTHDFRSDHDRLFHPGNQDRAASRVRPGDGQGGVRRPARRPAADRLVLLCRLRSRGPAHRAGAGRWTAGHDLAGGLLARAGHRGEAGRGDRCRCHREGACARRRWRPPGGHRHRPRWQCPRVASGPVTADPRSRAQRRRDTEHRLTHDIDVWVAGASADGAPYLVPLFPYLPAPRPGLARGERAARPRADARRPLVGLTPRPGAPRGRGSEAPRAEAKENQTYLLEAGQIE